MTVEERGARYPLTIDPTAQQAYLKASNTGSRDLFGYAAATSRIHACKHAGLGSSR